MLLQRVGLEKCRASFLVFLAIEVGDAFLEALASGGGRCRVVLGVGRRGAEEIAGNHAGAEDSSPEPVGHDRGQ